MVVGAGVKVRGEDFIFDISTPSDLLNTLLNA